MKKFADIFFAIFNAATFVLSLIALSLYVIVAHIIIPSL